MAPTVTVSRPPDLDWLSDEDPPQPAVASKTIATRAEGIRRRMKVPGLDEVRVRSDVTLVTSLAERVLLMALIHAPL